MRSFTLATLLLLASAPAAAQSIFTYAGGGSVDGRPATVVPVRSPHDVVVDRIGNLYIASPDEHRVWKVDAATGVISTFAGTGAEGFSGDGGAATQATLHSPENLAIDRAGNLLIVDKRNDRVRRVDLVTGVIATVIGGGGKFTENVPAIEAYLTFPDGLAVDRNGDIYITVADGVRKVTAATGIISRVAGGGTGGDGGPATQAQFISPKSVAVDPAGNVYISQWTPSNKIRRVDGKTGIVTTFAGTGVAGFSGDGGPASAARLNRPMHMTIGEAGQLDFTEYDNFVVRRIDLMTGIITSIAGTPEKSGTGGFGDGGPATAARFFRARGIARDQADNLYISDEADNRVRKIDAGNARISTVAGNGQVSLALSDGGPATAAILSLSTNRSARGGGLVSVDSSGNLYIADTNNDVIRKVNATSGTISRVAGAAQGSGTIGDSIPATRSSLFFPCCMTADASGNIYFNARGFEIHRVDAATGLIRKVAGGGTGGDGVPATQASVMAYGLAIDDAGNIYIAEKGGNSPYSSTSRIRRVDAVTGFISTIAGGASTFTSDGIPATSFALCEPLGVAVDAARNVYIADCWGILKVDGSGTIRRIAGKPGAIRFTGDAGPATAAEFNTPRGVAVDGSGNVYIADSGNFRVRKVDAKSGIINTIAGRGSTTFGGGGFTGDGGAATQAHLTFPSSIAVSREGDVYIADSDSNRIRVVPACLDVAPASLSSPANNSSGLTSFPKLSWRAVKGAFRYDVLVDTANPPKTLVASNITTTSFSPANLDSLTTYYWQVVAKGDPYCTPPSSAASEIRAFTTSAECGPPSQP